LAALIIRKETELEVVLCAELDILEKQVLGGYNLYNWKDTSVINSFFLDAGVEKIF